MAEVTITAGSPIKESLGSLGLYIYQITDVDDAETLTTGISGIVGFWVNWIGNPGTQTSAGGHATISGGTITLYPAVDDLAATVYIVGRF